MNSKHSKIAQLRDEFLYMQINSPGLKPNFSAVSRETGISRKTINKLWNNPNPPVKIRQKRKSKFDPFREEISEHFKTGSPTIKSAYLELQERYPEVFTSYSSFKNYVRTNHLGN